MGSRFATSTGPRNIHAAAAAAPRPVVGLSTWQPRRRRDPSSDYPRRRRNPPASDYPKSPRGSPTRVVSSQVPDFLAALPSLDADFKTRAADAAAAGKTLRYAATVADGKLDVGLQAVALDSPLGSLSGTDNLVEYYTKWYPTSPLVVQGAGAGAGTTAAGVIADMVDLARGA